MSLDHFVLQFTKMLGGVGWVVCVNIARMCGGVSNNVHFFLCMVFEAIGYIFMVYIKYMDGFFLKKKFRFLSQLWRDCWFFVCDFVSCEVCDDV